jgi:hypothetical protein
MSKINEILSKLNKPRKAGKGYRAPCPVHGGKGDTMSITEKDGGYIVANCFSCGAGGPELCEVLGLPLSLIFPDDDYRPCEITKDMRAKNIEDAFFKMIATKERKLNLEDSRSLRRVNESLKGYKIKADQAGIDHVSEDHPALKLYSVDYGEAVKDSPALRDALVDATWDGIEARAKADDFSSENRFSASENRLTTKQEIEDWLFKI